MTSNGCSADVEPVDVLRREFFCGASLDGIDPTYERNRQHKIGVRRQNRGEGRVRAFIPGIGSFPCLFKKAEYASMNFCA